MNRSVALWIALFLAAAPKVARAGEAAKAEEPSSISSTPSSVVGSTTSGWVLSGAPVGVGRNALLGEVGWPGLGLTLLHGQSERFDLGGTFAFVYGLEGIPNIAPGLRLNAVLRLSLLDQAKVNVGLRVSPGVVTYFPSAAVYLSNFAVVHKSYVMFGLSIPVELVVGIPVVSQVSVNVGVSVPMAIFFAPDVSFLLPIEPGFGVEYKFDQSLSLTFDSRYGASIFFVRDHSAEAHFGFRVLFGVAYKF